MNATPRRGYTILEMMIAISLVALGLTISTKMVASILSTTNQMASARRVTAATDEAVRRLRIDLERSESLQFDGGQLTLAGVQWNADETGLIRTAGSRIERFELPGEHPQFRPLPTGVALTIGGTEWTLPSTALLAEKPS